MRGEHARHGDRDPSGRGAILKDIMDTLVGGAPPGVDLRESHEADLLRVCTMLHDDVPDYDWVGMYLIDPDRPHELRLGPYAGEPLDHGVVPFGQGAVGSAAQKNDVFVVPDLETLPLGQVRHTGMRSELAAPIVHDGEVVGALAVDSALPSAFQDADRTFLRRIGEMAGPVAARLAREGEL